MHSHIQELGSPEKVIMTLLSDFHGYVLRTLVLNI